MVAISFWTLTYTADKDKSKDNPHLRLTCAFGCDEAELLYPWQLNSNPLAFTRPCNPGDELTHDITVVGDVAEGYSVQQCTCLDADF